MTRRYYVADLPAAGGTIPLSDDESAHAARVMRAAPGDSVTLFDGRGNESVAVIASIDRRQCVVNAQPTRPIDREPQRRIRLAVALPKPDRTKALVERLTELGVRKLTPLVCQRTQRPPSASQLQKLRRIVIESCKQCGRNRLMEIDEPVRIDLCVQACSDEVRLIAHPQGQRPAVTTLSNSGDVTAIVGPEGGFTDAEVRHAETNGFTLIGLGKRIYRVETAACVLAAWLTD